MDIVLECIIFHFKQNINYISNNKMKSYLINLYSLFYMYFFKKSLLFVSFSFPSKRNLSLNPKENYEKGEKKESHS